MWGVQSAQKTRPQYLDKGLGARAAAGGGKHLQWCLRLNMENDAAHCGRVRTGGKRKG